MGLECSGGELEVYPLLGMDVGTPTSIPFSFKGTYCAWPVPYPRAAQAPTPIFHTQPAPTDFWHNYS